MSNAAATRNESTTTAANNNDDEQPQQQPQPQPQQQPQPQHDDDDDRAALLVTILPKDLIIKILSHLGTPSDFGTCARVCRFFHKLLFCNQEEDDEKEDSKLLWEEIARRRYGSEVFEATIQLYSNSSSSSSSRDMLRDDNKEGALPTISNNIIPCYWKFNDDAIGLFYCCLIVAIKFDRRNDKIYVYMDVRGEEDLRHPFTSSIRIEDHPEQRYSTFPTFQGQWHSEGGNDEDDIDSTILTTATTTGTRRNYKGYLSFPARLFRSVSSGVCRFCYANVQHGVHADYQSVPILTIQNDGRLQDAFISSSNGKCCYTLDVSPFRNDTPEVEQRRWQNFEPRERER